MIDNYGYIRLTDFGLSKKTDPGNKLAYSVCGTPEYLAPEIVLKQGHGKAVDWWSLGSIIYEMYSGLPPYYSEDRAKLFENIKNNEVEYPKNMSPNLRNLLEGLFVKNPSLRLGADGSLRIKYHPWFANIDWAKIYN